MSTLSSRSFRLGAALLAFAVLPLLTPVSQAERPQRLNGPGHQNGAGQSPRSQKEQALADLTDVRDAVAAGAPDVFDVEEAVEELDDAIEELVESLEPELWLQDDGGNIDGTRLDPEEGHEVFHEERHCAQEIFDAIREGEIENPDLRGELLAIVDALVSADRALAEVAINDALDAGGEAEEIAEAQGYFARGDEQVAAAAKQKNLGLRAALLYTAMDGSYRHAWSAAIDALDD